MQSLPQTDSIGAPIPSQHQADALTSCVYGQVYMNGGPRGRAFKRVSAYVAQEDVFEPVLTAWETLQFHANLRLPRATTRIQQHDRMTDVIQTMGLWKSRNTQV